MIMCYVTFYRITVGLTIRTVLDRSVTNSRWQLGAILETSSKDFCLKTCINILPIFAIFTSPHVFVLSCNLLRFANYIINLYVYVCICIFCVFTVYR